MQIRLNKYQEELTEINHELEALPEGHLVKKKGFYSHYLGKKNIVGITKNPELIRKLCRKKYLLARRKQLLTNFSLPIVRAVFEPAEAIIQSLPALYQDLPRANFYHPAIEKWQNQPPTLNPYPQEGNSYTSKKGVTFRSKSEYLIASLLEEYGLPYKYEEALKIGSKTFYPDFIIKNPYTGKSFLWEHFGALHQQGYEQKMYDKMRGYYKHGYRPFDTLIYTFDFDLTSAHLRTLIEGTLL